LIGNRTWLQGVRFGLTGLLNTAFGYVVFAAFILVGVGPLVAICASTAAGVAFNFQTSRRIVFRTDGKGRGLQFVAVYAAVLAVNWSALRVLHGYGMSELLAQALLAPPLAVISFLGQKIFVFTNDGGPA
jgi:putative flippase GtrA